MSTGARGKRHQASARATLAARGPCCGGPTLPWAASPLPYPIAPSSSTSLDGRGAPDGHASFEQVLFEQAATECTGGVSAAAGCHVRVRDHLLWMPWRFLPAVLAVGLGAHTMAAYLAMLPVLTRGPRDVGFLFPPNCPDDRSWHVQDGSFRTNLMCDENFAYTDLSARPRKKGSSIVVTSRLTRL